MTAPLESGAERAGLTAIEAEEMRRSRAWLRGDLTGHPPRLDVLVALIDRMAIDLTFPRASQAGSPTALSEEEREMVERIRSDAETQFTVTDESALFLLAIIDRLASLPDASPLEQSETPGPGLLTGADIASLPEWK